MKTAISRKIEWDMGHRIPDHKSLCKNLHGHRYVVEVSIEGPVIEEFGNPERGMVKDFTNLKEAIVSHVAFWDHGLMLYTGDIWLATLRELETKIIEVEFIPTAENIAKDIWNHIRRSFEGQLTNVEVTVWETPNCKATVTR